LTLFSPDSRGRPADGVHIAMFLKVAVEAEPAHLTATLTQLRIKYSRAEAERLTIADANAFQFTNAQMQREIQEMRCLGSLDALIVHHGNNKQKNRV
jgi:hypothetical protein